ncbi:permease [Paenibacillus allorhizosphaerae]|uniref:Two-component membrane permease complex subunit SMU_747c n=1 Tax=Paenibacillus allorhizosphaerae TaxID=2849866 RepID=A0ABM8VM92_9BACL|nr:permease [Paenibacillus allorhizosphaerae]CAG7649589.1 Putative two-component membrane permease complex subunit SMU_747c [Paenibacillus allorhizosphaerae]
MQNIIFRWSTNILAVLCLVMLYLIYTQKEQPDLSFLASDSLQSFKTLFISIILEAFPFVLLGVLVSALLQMFVSEQTIRRLVPKNPVLGIVFACVMGIIFPLCECGMIPVIRRLMRKGMPVYVAVVFILAGPILNPVVYASTYMAFRSRPEIAYARMGLAFVAALIIGLVIYRFVRRNPLRGAEGAQPHRHEHHVHPQHDHHDGHNRNHQHDHAQTIQRDHSHDQRSDHAHHGHHAHDHSHPAHDHRHDHGGNRLFSLLGHASDEFFDMGKYLIFGAFLTAIIQTMVARESLVSIGQGEVSSHLFMMGLAYVLSLCSTSDAFVASSFATTFSTGSLLTFLVFGPMLDIKSTLMMLSAFRAKFVLQLSALVFVVVLAVSLLYERIFIT